MTNLSEGYLVLDLKAIIDNWIESSVTIFYQFLIYLI